MRHFHSTDPNLTLCGRDVPKDWKTSLHYAVTCQRCLVLVYKIVVGCITCDWKGPIDKTLMLRPAKKRICPRCFAAGTPERPNISAVKDEFGALVVLPPSNFEPEDEDG